jgi:hypothetical protein
MCTVLLPPGGYPTAVNKYIISYDISISYQLFYHQNFIAWAGFCFPSASRQNTCYFPTLISTVLNGRILHVLYRPRGFEFARCTYQKSRIFFAIQFYSVLVTVYHLWRHSFIGFLCHPVFNRYPANVENMVSS